MEQFDSYSLQSREKEPSPRRLVSFDGICIKEVAWGDVHTSVVTEKRALYAWGGGQARELGVELLVE